MEDDDANYNRDSDVAPALIVVHPTQDSVAVSVGPDLRVFNLREGRQETLVEGSDLDTQSSLKTIHKDSIRAIRYGANGKLFVSAGDDKLVKIWSTGSWRCILTVLSEKRVTAVAISNSGDYVCFADKFGVVYVVDVKGYTDEQASVQRKGIPMFSHYCSIITSLEFSPDDGYIVSADRDFKIRVTNFPSNPLEGAREIQSFCLGHTEFVSSLSFVCSQDHINMFLISGGGDSTVRLWDHTSGHLLDTISVGTETGSMQRNEKDDINLPAVTDLCSSVDGSLIAVAVQSFSGVVLMSCDLLAKTLSVVKTICMEDEIFIPTSIRSVFLESVFWCWMVMGASRLDCWESDTPLACRVRVLKGKREPESGKEDVFDVLGDQDIGGGGGGGGGGGAGGGGDKLLKELQGSLTMEKKVFVAAATAEAVKKAMGNLLIKKHYYSQEKRENRKRGRNDKKNKQI